jgi:hypothetical protein
MSSMPKGPSAPTLSAPAQAARPLPSEPQALTLGLLARLGTGMILQTAGLELHQELEVNGARYRFSATQVSGTTLRADWSARPEKSGLRSSTSPAFQAPKSWRAAF